MEDVEHELENQRHSCVNLEKKQRQFDKQLQEERLIATTRAEERDQSQARERAAESKAFSLQREIEELTDRTETLERQLRAKEAEISELESCQDKVKLQTVFWRYFVFWNEFQWNIYRRKVA